LKFIIKTLFFITLFGFQLNSNAADKLSLYTSTMTNEQVEVICRKLTCVEIKLISVDLFDTSKSLFSVTYYAYRALSEYDFCRHVDINCNPHGDKDKDDDDDGNGRTAG